jgi:hypothetical protein
MRTKKQNLESENIILVGVLLIILLIGFTAIDGYFKYSKISVNTELIK